MPESPSPKPRRHPWESFKAPRDPSVPPSSPRRTRPDAPAYAELQAATNFTFLLGASHADELVERAKTLGLRALAVTDLHSVAGIVRAHVAAKEAGVPLVVGATVELAADASLGDPCMGEDARASSTFATSPAPCVRALLHATSRVGYATLCRLLTIGKRRAPKGECRLALHDLLEHHEDLLVTVIPPPILDRHAVETLDGLRAWLNHRGRGPRGPGRGDDRLSIAAARRFDGNDRARLHQLRLLSEHVGVPLVAVNDVLHHAPERQRLQDVLTCIRNGCTVRTAGLRLQANAERHLKGPTEMARLFAGLPDALRRSVDLADRAVGFSLDELHYEYPDEVVPPGCTPMAHLRTLTWSGAADRYPGGVPERVRRQIEHEFALIDELGYAPYFLTVHDLCVFARSRGILHQRGAAANSAVCYCLAVTAVDPDRIDVLFERFVSRERNEPPDIDIDFEHERREEVIQYIYRKYGRDRAALTAEVITYRGRSAVRDVGKALGLSLDCVDRLAKGIDWWSSGTVDDRQLRELSLRPEDPTVRLLIDLTRELLGFPRHLSQHVGGFVITRGPLCEMVPVENAAMPDRTVIEWDKDDIDAMGMLKVDVLGLGMLTCLRKAMELASDWKGRRDEGTKGQREVCSGRNSDLSGSACVASGNATCGGGVLDNSSAAVIGALRLDKPNEACGDLRPFVPLALSDIPPEDPLVYDMICRADTVGVFQIESRAQMSMLPRLKPRCFYDLVIEVAIVRPGPIQGDMVHPYLRRRDGLEPVVFPDDAVRRVLGKTLGVPLFQEQAMSLAIVAAGFTPGEADQLRRAIAAWKSRGNKLAYFGERIVSGMIARGYSPTFAEQCFNQIKGFSGYGFPESHAASFALLVYASAWLKLHHPAAFAAALINSQPMGFYAPAQIVRDAEEHGVTVLPIDVNRSGWDCQMEAAADAGGDALAAPAGAPALRLGLRMVRGLAEEDGQRIAEAVRRHGPFDTVGNLHRASGVRVAVLRRLAAADAFGSMGLDRQQATWVVAGMADGGMELFEAAAAEAAATILPAGAGEGRAGCAIGGRAAAPAGASDACPVPDRDPSRPQPRVPRPAQPGASPAERSDARPPRSEAERIPLPSVPPLRSVALDYAATGVSLRAHPISFIREELVRRGVAANERLRDETSAPSGTRIAVAGLVLVRQRPSTAKGIVFMTLEDETAVANLIVRPKVYQRYRRIARHGVAVLARGTIERQGQVVHVVVRRLEDLGPELAEVQSRSRDFH